MRTALAGAFMAIIIHALCRLSSSIFLDYYTRATKVAPRASTFALPFSSASTYLSTNRENLTLYGIGWAASLT